MVSQEQIAVLRDGLRVLAPAKINLSLLVAGTRPDGFHEIETIMAKVNFFDEILIQQGKKAGIELICNGPYWAPQGEKNLVYQACKLLLDSCRCRTNIKLTLTKNIPAGSGLGSASSDAAATLIGVDKFLDLKSGTGRLGKFAVQLGSDVNFFLNGPLAFCTGKGEKIKELAKKFNFLCFLALPDVSISTKRVYENYKHNEALFKRVKGEIKPLIEKNRFDLVSKMCVNMLQTTCLNLYKGLADLKAEIERWGLAPLCVSGSGSALFHIRDISDEQFLFDSQELINRKTGCKSVIATNNRW
ncbi:MAG: 4-(cytidine 5'-diphospho)-2-C-methyl-D-erythritol kinase [Sedimentisphaerales bacterium]|nr:4-(cytidine 5'-diphospho)-2-C-methyl-D-erythritol kinase [Sedimentisphaerales bacterium]